MFFTVPFFGQFRGDIIRIGSLLDGNQIIITCTTLGNSTPETPVNTTLGERQFYEFTAADGVDPQFCCIESSRPCAVFQYSQGHTVDVDFHETSLGDPFMLWVAPVKQAMNNYRLGFLAGNTIPNSGNFTSTKINIAVASTFFDQSQILIDGSQARPLDADGWQPIFCASGEICGYGGRFEGSDTDTKTIAHTNPMAGMNIYGYGFGDEFSYGYPAGFEMDPISRKLAM